MCTLPWQQIIFSCPLLGDLFAKRLFQPATSLPKKADMLRQAGEALRLMSAQPSGAGAERWRSQAGSDYN